MITTEEKARLVRLMAENLSRLPLHDRLAVALNLVVVLAKNASIPRKSFFKMTEDIWNVWNS